MNWAPIIGAGIKVVFLILYNWVTKNQEEKEKHEAILKELQESVDADDNDRITRVLERIRLRPKK